MKKIVFFLMCTYACTGFMTLVLALQVKQGPWYYTGFVLAVLYVADFFAVGFELTGVWWHLASFCHLEKFYSRYSPVLAEQRRILSSSNR